MSDITLAVTHDQQTRRILTARINGSSITVFDLTETLDGHPLRHETSTYSMDLARALGRLAEMAANHG